MNYNLYNPEKLEFIKYTEFNFKIGDENFIHIEKYDYIIQELIWTGGTYGKKIDHYKSSIEILFDDEKNLKYSRKYIDLNNFQAYLKEDEKREKYIDQDGFLSLIICYKILFPYIKRIKENNDVHYFLNRSYKKETRERKNGKIIHNLIPLFN